MDIKEMREITGQTQQEFADRFGIPVGTIRRWEYGESTPAPYIIRLIAEKIPIESKLLRKIEANDEIYYYDQACSVIIDAKGTRIPISENLDGVKEQNLVMYANSLFESYYEALETFNMDCKLDKTEDIIWE